MTFMPFKINRIIKLSFASVILTASQLACATGAGLYLGAQGGQTNTHNQTLEVQTGTTPAYVSTTPENTGYGGRVYGGVGINEYAAVEFGFTHYAPSTYKPSISTLCGDPQIRENAVDLVGKGSLPFDNFAVFAKAGVAYLMTSSSGSLTSQTISACGGSSSNNSARPTYGFGASYDLTPSWVADVSYSRVSGGGGVESADLIALGISYHFVDKYCGQFLC